MQNRFTITFVLVLIIFGCSNNNKSENIELGKDKKASLERLFFERVDSYLPKHINRLEYTLIYRTGSIEFSSDLSVLCIPKKLSADKYINCEYFMLNNIEKLYQDNPDLNSNEPKILGFSFILNNTFYDKNPSFEVLDKWHIDELNKYIDKRLTIRQGEGHCNNFYYCSTSNEDSVYVIDYTSRNLEKNFFESLYKQISPSEYFQTSSLKEGCNKERELYLDLNKVAESDSFKLIHGDEGKYW